MARKKKAADDEQEEVYHVEVVTKARVSEEGDWEYLIKWAGYGSDADSWEPAENVKQCDRLLGSFWRHVGIDDEDYPIGYEVAAREEWINKEKKYFAETFVKSAGAEKTEKETRKKDDKRKSRVTASKSNDSHSESSDDVPLAKGLPKKRRVIHLKSDSNSDANKSFHPPLVLRKPGTLSSGSSNPLKSLSFKKSKPQAPAIQAKDYTKLTSTNATPLLPETSKLPPPSASGTDKEDTTDISFSSLPEDIPTFEPAIEPSEQFVAEQFLKTIDLPALSAPILESESTAGSVNVQKVTAMKVGPLRIPKKWKWSGDLLISTSDRVELLCNVTIKNSTGSGDGSPISMLMAQMDMLRMSKLYHVSELWPLLQACGKPQYFAQLESTECQDQVLIQGLIHHMTHQQHVAIIVLSLDYSEVAALVMFPVAFSPLVKLLQVPDDQVVEGSLQVALIPFSIPLPLLVKIGHKPIQDVQALSPSLGRFHSLHKKPIIFQAIVCLGFPASLLEFLDSPNRTYAVWFSLSDCGQSTSGLETAHLQLILGATKATPCNVKDDVRVVFIHIGSISRIQTLPSVASKLSEYPETQFFTYGTHPSVDSQRWGVHEIFPLGGIVSFTPAALAEEPVHCYQMMLKISEHPIWDCFVTPSVLAAGNFLAKSNNSSSSSSLDHILELIDAGQVSLIRFPGRGSKQPWLPLAIQEHTLAGDELLKACSADSDGQMDTPGINNELVQNMAKIQQQPHIMDNYRRFVIIRAPSETDIPYDKDGFEWCSFDSFNFKDNFFGDCVVPSTDP
ncbi:hypothetical protein EDD17DRAFT_1619414 [Pisolithus thermaeus]|nr:hypothetical protein EV401DRAFT_1909326 [Pisolithus croceorrhizus]KAI6158720.1 hypothetical protein EDD17DRAFT_1619414 [Pisolithus thermaeus]